MKNFVKIEIETTSLEEGEILMAELSENNFYAFEQNEISLISYINEEDFNENNFKKLLPENATYKKSIIEEKNWNADWESQFQPVIINTFAGVRASFHKPLTGIEHEIIITPKMSFGTGHHATTFLMIELMQSIDFKNKKVLDFGTGTGILAILAEKLGAASVVAVDYDQWSIMNCSENIAANNCKHITIEQKSNIQGGSGVDIILANINLSVLKENAKHISTMLAENSVLLLSGILLSDEKNLASVFEKNGFVKKKLAQRKGWIALLFQKQ